MHKFILLLTIFLFAATSLPAANTYPLIPRPVKLDAKEGQFTLNARTQIRLPVGSEALRPAVDYFAGLLQPATGYSLPVLVGEKADNAFYFVLDEGVENAEGYHLDIERQRVTIRAATAAGAFYAVQTLRQLLPHAVETGGTTDSISWSIPCAEIDDYPRYRWRGLHLDVGRHFFSVDFIKRYLDLMALHKLNTFHWHLTEDQGWRIEIKQYPKLAEVAAWRDSTVVGRNYDKPRRFDGQPYGGYYTQEQVKEVVAYAQRLFITVVPEVEMPGHSQAVLAAYPELGCTKGPYRPATYWGVFQEIYCTTDETFTFLENVLDEVMALFPSEYIHIGGDEAPKARWKECAHCQAMIKREQLKDEHGLQSYFIRRIEKHLNANGRRLIGWDEILEGGLAPNATVMSWRGTEGGIAAAKQRHDVVMSPTTYLYLDYYQGDKATEPLAIGGDLPLEKVYGYDPLPSELTEEEAKHIIGVQANVWTEYLATPAKVEYMVYPRALALAEMAWTPAEGRTYDNFLSRLRPYGRRLDALRVNYAKHAWK